MKEKNKQQYLLTSIIDKNRLKSAHPDKYNACTLQGVLILAFGPEKSIRVY